MITVMNVIILCLQAVPLSIGKIMGYLRFFLKSNQTAITTASWHVIGVRVVLHFSLSLYIQPIRDDNFFPNAQTKMFCPLQAQIYFILNGKNEKSWKKIDMGFFWNRKFIYCRYKTCRCLWLLMFTKISKGHFHQLIYENMLCFRYFRMSPLYLGGGSSSYNGQTKY